VVHAKNGEQVPSPPCLSWLAEELVLSAQQSSNAQQGMIVPAMVMMRRKMESHFFIGGKDKENKETVSKATRD